jgi:Trp operon repressor
MYNAINCDNWETLLTRYMRIQDREDARVFLNAILTYAERQEIPKRVRILEELFKNELTQKDIAAKLNVSIANVTRGVNTIRSINYDLKGLFNRINANGTNCLNTYGSSITEDGWLEFLDKYLMVINDLEEARQFLTAVLTHAEREEFPKRVRILEEIYKDKLPQHEIANKLKVSHANVSRGVNTIRSIQPHYNLKAVLDQMNKK